MLFGKKNIGTVAYMGGISNLPEPFCWSWSQMIQYNNDYLVQPGEAIYYDKSNVSYHSFARNALIKRMKGDWILMLDTDHQFDPDIVARMVQRMTLHDVGVVTALYQYKFDPYAPVLYRRINKSFQVVGDWDQEVPFQEIDSAGAGCLLIRKDIIARIQDELHEEPFDIMPPNSEDHSFFERLHKLKIKAYVDTTIECNHLVYKPITLDDYDKTAFPMKKYRKEGRKLIWQ